MLLFETIDRLDRIHRMIRLEATGSPEEFAERIGVKKRQLYNILDEFKDFGADVRYSRNKNSFYYENDFEVSVKITVMPLSQMEKATFVAGCCGVYRPFILNNLERIFSSNN